MADKRKHRGPHPADVGLFSTEALPNLRAAFADFCWLLDRGYAVPSSLKLVGDRYTLQERQRTAVKRAACSKDALERRAARRVELDDVEEIWIDGFNLLTTIEAAIAGGVVLVGRDGCHRDMASMHGTYRSVEETKPALSLIGKFLQNNQVQRVHWLLDQPVSNSGRLATSMRGIAETCGWDWQVELVRDPDPILSAKRADVIASADSEILNRCGPWVNLAAMLVQQIEPDFVVDFID